jgi:hypothetical protein
MYSNTNSKSLDNQEATPFDNEIERDKDSAEEKSEDFLENLGTEIGDFLSLLNYPKDDFKKVALKSRCILPKGIEIQNKWERCKKESIDFESNYFPGRLTKLGISHLLKNNENGYNIYFVVNGQGQDKKEIRYCHCLYFDIDKDSDGNLIPKDEQYKLITNKMGGLEPTVAVDTGGKSLHLYYTYKSPVEKEKGIPLLVDAIAHVGVADEACKDVARILRIPKFKYYDSSGKCNGNVSKIYKKTGNRYSFEELDEIIPGDRKGGKKVKTKQKNKIVIPKEGGDKNEILVIIEDENLENFANLVLGGKALENWLNAEKIADGKQEPALDYLVRELVAGSRKGYFSQNDGNRLASNFLERLINYDSNNPWQFSHLAEKWARYCAEEKLEYNSEESLREKYKVASTDKFILEALNSLFWRYKIDLLPQVESRK